MAQPRILKIVFLTSFEYPFTFQVVSENLKNQKGVLQMTK